MSAAKLHSLPANEDLSAAIAANLAARNSRDLSGTLILTPGQRLKAYLQRAITDLLPACIPPKILTPESLIKFLPQTLPARRIGSVQQRLIVATLLNEEEQSYYKPGMENDICHFFNELADADLDESVFSEAKTLLHDDAFRDDRHVTRLEEMLDELLGLHQRYYNFLAQHRLEDRAAAMRSRLRIPQKTLVEALDSYADTYIIAGFTDASAVQVVLLKAILKLGGTELWLHGDTDFLSQRLSHHPMQILQELLANLDLSLPLNDQAIDGSSSFARAVFTLEQGQKCTEPEVSLHECSTPLAEIKSALALARELVQHGRCAADEIAIVVPDEGMYGRLLWAATQESHIPVNFALRFSILQTVVGQWLHLVMRLLQENMPIAALLDMFGNPVSTYWLNKIDQDLDRQQVQSELQKFATDTGLHSGLKSYLQRESLEKFPQAQKVLLALENQFGAFLTRDKRSCSDWLALFWQLTESLALEAYVFGDGDHNVEGEPEHAARDRYNLEQRALLAWLNSLQGLETIAALIPEAMPLSQFLRQLQQSLLGAEIRPAGEPFIGVQIINLLEVRSLPLQAVLVLGNHESQFPGHPGYARMLQEPIRRKLLLPTLEKYERQQDLLFFQLMSHFQQVHLFYSEANQELPQVASRYVQRLKLLRRLNIAEVSVQIEAGHLLKGDFMTLPAEQVRASADLAKTHTTLQQSVKARLDLRGHYRGSHQQVLQEVSATTLDHYLKCSYRFLLERCKMQRIELPDEDFDPRQVGEWLHKVCEYFFKGLQAPKSSPMPPDLIDLLEPWPEPVTAENHEAALSRLRRLTRYLMMRYGGRLDYLYQMFYAGWPAFLEQEIEAGAWQFDPNHFEYEFNASIADSATLLGLPVHVRGRVDRLARGEILRLVDYKLSKPSRGKSAKALKEGKDVQLPLYYAMLRQMDEFAAQQKWQAEYFVLKDGDRSLRLTELPEDRQLDVAWQVLVESWRARNQKLLPSTARLVPEVDPDVCGYCNFAGVCRRNEHFYLKNPDAAP